MTDEKESCNFQQNYNVFGLDDKPCCYLYHKYCDEIDNCYFKRYKLLEQENKKLLNARNHFMAENLKYFNALEEIREMAKFAQSLPCSDFLDCDNCDDEITNNGQFCMHKRIEEIKTKIEEVLNEN